MFRSVKRIQEFATALELVRGQRFVLHFLLVLTQQQQHNNNNNTTGGGGGGFLSTRARVYVRSHHHCVDTFLEF